MLPFLKPKKLADIVYSKKSDNANKQEESMDADSLKQARDLIEAIHSKDEGRLARALKQLVNPDVNTLRKDDVPGA